MPFVESSKVIREPPSNLGANRAVSQRLFAELYPLGSMRHILSRVAKHLSMWNAPLPPRREVRGDVLSRYCTRETECSEPTSGVGSDRSTTSGPTSELR